MTIPFVIWHAWAGGVCWSSAFTACCLLEHAGTQDARGVGVRPAAAKKTGGEIDSIELKDDINIVMIEAMRPA